jgi:hypothetical protein
MTARRKVEFAQFLLERVVESNDDIPLTALVQEWVRDVGKTWSRDSEDWDELTCGSWWDHARCFQELGYPVMLADQSTLADEPYGTPDLDKMRDAVNAGRLLGYSWRGNP